MKAERSLQRGVWGRQPFRQQAQQAQRPWGRAEQLHSENREMISDLNKNKHAGEREHATGEPLEREAGWGVSSLPGLVSLDLI